jgi:hypothetical protein
MAEESHLKPPKSGAWKLLLCGFVARIKVF